MTVEELGLTDGDCMKVMFDDGLCHHCPGGCGCKCIFHEGCSCDNCDYQNRDPAPNQFAPFSFDEELMGTAHGDVGVDPTVPGYAELYAATNNDATAGAGNPTRLAAVLQGYALAAPEALVLPPPQD